MNRQLAPEIKTIKSLRTGFPDKIHNLFTLISEEGVFKLEIVFPHSGYGVIENKFHGLYGMDLLLSGTGDNTADEIAEKIDTLGGFIFKSCDYYSSSVTVFGMNENILKLLEIVKDCITNCNFDQKELEIYKTRKISDLKINLTKTDFLANRSINQILTGAEHPYSKVSTEESINHIKQGDLLNFKKKNLINPYFIFTGSEQTQIENILLHSGFDISVSENTIIPEKTLSQDGKAVDLITKSGSSQNSIRMGKVLPSRNNYDYFKISLLNLILGGYFGSRLMKNIREDKGLTYGIHSSLIPFKEFTLFKISSECNSKLSEQVKNEIFHEINILQTIPIGEEELLIAKNYLLGALSRNFDGSFNVSERLKSFLDLDTLPNFYQSYFEAINSITSAQLLECANNYFQINTLKYCIAGEI